MSKKVKMTGPNGGTLVFSSATAASRCLSGYGDTSVRTTIARRCSKPTGGYLGKVKLRYTK